MTGDEVDEAIKSALATSTDSEGNPATLATVYLRNVREVKNLALPRARVPGAWMARASCNLCTHEQPAMQNPLLHDSPMEKW